MSLRGSGDVSEYVQALATMNSAIERAKEQHKAYAEDVDALSEAISSTSSTTEIAIVGLNLFSKTFSDFQKAFASAADLAAGNVDELVNLYQAQIKVIQTQNTYTQALALAATATTVYGKGTEQSGRAQLAANYVNALYVQSKKDEQVAQMQYVTASTKNVLAMTQSFMNFAQMLMYVQSVMQFVMLSAQISAQRAAIAAIPLVGIGLSLGMMAYQFATTPAMPKVPQYGTGGTVGRTGLAYVHAGERITPASGTGASGGDGMGVQIHIHVYNSSDLPKVRQEVQNTLAQSWYEASKQRGTY